MAQRGGKRPGAGRPRGVTAGTKHERLEKMLRKGAKTPLQYMLNILNDKKTSPEKKMWAAEKAAPFVHPRLSSIDQKLQGDKDEPVEIEVKWKE
jgi:hypothetical protein|tara:strand:+ start:398 stop:679 length:282 start_codon:yes stop_codon:yes gene_type:complete